jgi:hypothetical protein
MIFIDEFIPNFRMVVRFIVLMEYILAIFYGLIDFFPRQELLLYHRLALWQF